MSAMNRKQVKGRSRTARAEACVWVVKLQDPNRTPEFEKGLRAWLAASPENAHQFERVTEVWDAGAVPVPGMPRVAHDPDQVQPQRWQLAAVLALVIIGAGVWGANNFWLSPSYATGIGEQRILQLSDGSRVTLNTDSAVVVSYRRNERRISIDHGEAFFEVAEDASRPFRVRAGEQYIEAHGTSFIVRRESQQVTVTLVTGRVAVSDLGPSTPSVTLTEGQRVRVSDAGLPLEFDEPDMEVVTAWRRGEVILDSTPLADAIAEMNRYDQRQLVIDDPAINAMRISGVYHIGGNKRFAAMVAQLYGLGVQHRDGRIHLFVRGQTNTTE